jgi:hypothetical protein
MLYCLAVEEDSVNRPSGWVEWRRLGRTMWASEERTAPFSFSPIEDRTFRDALHLSRNSRSFDARRSVSTSAWELRRTSRGSAVYRPQMDSLSHEGWQGLRRPGLQPARNRTASEEQTAWPFTPRP